MKFEKAYFNIRYAHSLCAEASFTQHVAGEGTLTRQRQQNIKTFCLFTYLLSFPIKKKN